MDTLDRPASEREIAAMRRALGEALAAGAIGLSSGLWYAPASAAPRAELVALAQDVGAAGALYTTHMRDEADHVLDSLDESFRRRPRGIGAGGDLASQGARARTISAAPRETLPKIAAAIAAQPIGPRRLSLHRLLDRAAAAERAARAQGADHLVEEPPRGRRARARRRSRSEWGVSEEEACARLQPAGAIYFMMNEDDVRRVLAFEHTMIGSDGLPHDVHPHPRLWGTFARVLGHYCREERLFPLEEAVRKMTGLPAARFGLAGRGRLAAGAYADITVFDADAIIDRATFAAPTTPAAGIHLVLVNGQAVWRDGAATGARPGRALRRQHLQAERQIS